MSDEDDIKRQRASSSDAANDLARQDPEAIARRQLEGRLATFRQRASMLVKDNAGAQNPEQVAAALRDGALRGMGAAYHERHVQTRPAPEYKPFAPEPAGEAQQRSPSPSGKGEASVHDAAEERSRLAREAAAKHEAMLREQARREADAAREQAGLNRNGARPIGIREHAGRMAAEPQRDAPDRQDRWRGSSERTHPTPAGEMTERRQRLSEAAQRQSARERTDARTRNEERAQDGQSRDGRGGPSRGR